MPTPRPDSETCWGGFSLHGLNVEVKNDGDKAARMPPCYWGEGPEGGEFPAVHAGYSEARSLVCKGTVEDLTSLCVQAKDMLAQLFASIGNEREAQPCCRVVQLRLSPELELWKSTQQEMGNVLPPKGEGLDQASPEVLALLGAADWPESITTNGAIFGCGMTNLLVGGVDARTIFSNYVTDMVFYYEHGYHHVFPSFRRLIQDGLDDAHALRAPGGRQRRVAAVVGASYVEAKIALEKENKARLKNRVAQMDRRSAQVMFLLESSLLGFGAEATARGFDPAAVMSDLIFSSPGTDVVDVGSDLVNSELMNAFLNVADIAAPGIVSEPVLRTVYDAYAATGARMFTQRWHEPVARMCATLYPWHIQNNRHMFFRRALLGWPKARKSPAQPQREGDFDEVFDAEFHTTGVSRPLDPEYACDGGEVRCNHVRRLIDRQDQEDVADLLGALWWSVVTGPLEYVRQGEVDEQREKHLAESSRLRMAQLFSKGIVHEMAWLLAHANHHAWQVNYLFEAAMFGSLLDGGRLTGKLDRAEEKETSSTK